MSILTRTRLARLAATPHLADEWHFVAASALSACNHPDEVGRVFEYAIEGRAPADCATIARKMRESLMKTSVLSGLPKAINALSSLRKVTPVELRETKLQRQFLTTDRVDNLQGERFFDQVYGKVSNKIKSNMGASYPDLRYYILRDVYGPLLAFDGVLDPRESSFAIVASLLPQDVNPQLKGHLRGALNNGATKDEVNSVRAMCIDIGEWCGVKWTQEPSKL